MGAFGKTPGKLDGPNPDSFPWQSVLPGFYSAVMSRMTIPEEIRAEIGLRTRPFPLNEYRKYLGVTFVESGVRNGGATIWRPDRVTVALPPGPLELKRQDGSHELGHVANGDVGPHRPVLYRRGSGRGAALNQQIEDRATDWGVDALIGQGPLRLALFHEEIKSVRELAREFLVMPKFIVRAAVRYGLESFVLRDPEGYARYLQSADWIRRSKEILSARPVCERPCCGQPSAIMQHLHFDVLGRERPDDVVAMCRDCHGAIRLGPDVNTAQLALFSGQPLQAAS